MIRRQTAQYRRRKREIQMGKVFISYSSKDRIYVDKLNAVLRNGNIDIWIAPESIPVGSNYTECINDAIQSASAVVLVLSANSLKSPWVQREIERAVTYNIPIFSVQIDQAELSSSFAFMLGTTQIMSIPNLDAKPEDTVRLLTALGKTVQGSHAEPAESKAAETEPPKAPKPTEPKKTAEKQTAPIKTVPKQTVPKQTAPKQTEPKQTAPKQTAPKQTEPKQTAPKQTAPKQTEPKQTAPKQTAPKQTEPKQTAPKQTAQKQTEPKQTALKQTAQKQTEPKQTAPKQTAPKQTEPKQTEPKQTVPKQTVPKQTVPKQTAPRQTAPKQTTPKQTAPKPAAPKQTAPKPAVPKQTPTNPTAPRQTPQASSQQTRQTPGAPYAVPGNTGQKKNTGCIRIALFVIAAIVLFYIVTCVISFISSSLIDDYVTSSPATTAAAATESATARYSDSTTKAAADNYEYQSLSLNGYTLIFLLPYKSAADKYGIYNYSTSYTYTNGSTALTFSSGNGSDMYFIIEGNTVPDDYNDLSFIGVAITDSSNDICGFRPGSSLSQVTGSLGTDYEKKTAASGDEYLCYYYTNIYNNYMLAFFYDSSNTVTQIHVISLKPPWRDRPTDHKTGVRKT